MERWLNFERDARNDLNVGMSDLGAGNTGTIGEVIPQCVHGGTPPAVKPDSLASKPPSSTRLASYLTNKPNVSNSFLVKASKETGAGVSRVSPPLSAKGGSMVCKLRCDYHFTRNQNLPK